MLTCVITADIYDICVRSGQLLNVLTRYQGTAVASAQGSTQYMAAAPAASPRHMHLVPFFHRMSAAHWRGHCLGFEHQKHGAWGMRHPMQHMHTVYRITVLPHRALPTQLLTSTATARPPTSNAASTLTGNAPTGACIRCACMHATSASQERQRQAQGTCIWAMLDVARSCKWRPLSA